VRATLKIVEAYLAFMRLSLALILGGCVALGAISVFCVEFGGPVVFGVAAGRILALCIVLGGILALGIGPGGILAFCLGLDRRKARATSFIGSAGMELVPVAWLCCRWSACTTAFT